MNVSAEHLKERTRVFAVQILKLFQALPKTDEARIIGKQLLRSGTSVGANYRAVCRARSRAEFIAKIGIVVEEADETIFWLELIDASGIFNSQRLAPLLMEANELLAVFAASQLTAKSNSPTTNKSSISHSSIRQFSRTTA